MEIKTNKRYNSIPPYLFAEIDKKKLEAVKQGRKIISLGVGDPDMPTPEIIVKAGQKALANAENHHYPFGTGLGAFRRAVCLWMNKRFGLELHADKEILPLLGSKEGLAHILLAFVDPGDAVLIPEPGYPLYYNAAIFAGAEPHYMPLLEKNAFLPDFGRIPKNVARKAKLMFLNYPNNPTSACADRSFLESAVKFARENNIIIVYDAAYSEMYFKEPPVSFLSIKGAKDVSVELHSFSKTFNMTGWRIGWACGNEKIVNALRVVKDNYDSGVFNAVQEAGITALKEYDVLAEEIRRVYKNRRDFFIPLMRKIGWEINEPEATFYVWAKTPANFDSKKACMKLLDEADIIATPGVGFGPSGEGYVRFALTVKEDVLKEAVEKINRIKW